MMRSLFLILLSIALIDTSSICGAMAQEIPERAVTDRAADAESLYQESIFLSESGRCRQANIKLFQAVNLWQQSRRNDRIIEALLRLGEYYNETERWQYALECYKRLLKLQSLTTQTKVRALNSVAALYLCLHQFRLAGDYFRQSLDVSDDQQDAAVRSIALAGLAAVFAEDGKKQQAQDYLSRARKLAGQAGSRQAEAEALLFIGQIWREQGQSAEAREAFEDALSFYRQSSNDQQKQALLLCLLSDLHLASDPARAADLAMEALNLDRAIKTGGLQWRAYLALARAQRAMGDKKKALRSYWLSVSRIEKARLDLSADAFRVALLEERQSVYHELSSMLFEEGNMEEAFNVAEMARSRSTLDLIDQKRAGKKSSSTPEQNQSLEETAKKISLLNTQLRSAQLDPAQR
ncbi:MAG TPA: tetratricopeptide repeat protein, partial [Blastocatellia bacterium]